MSTIARTMLSSSNLVTWKLYVGRAATKEPILPEASSVSTSPGSARRSARRRSSQEDVVVADVLLDRLQSLSDDVSLPGVGEGDRPVVDIGGEQLHLATAVLNTKSLVSASW